MANHLRAIRPNEPSLVQVDYFQNDPAFHEGWSSKLSGGNHFLSDRYWRFMQDSDSYAAQAVGDLAFGIIGSTPEFRQIRGLGTATVDGTYIDRKVGYFSLIMVGTAYFDQEQLTTSIIERTNERLLALNSAYHLPLEIPIIGDSAPDPS
jgi:hypothetical protein